MWILICRKFFWFHSAFPPAVNESCSISSLAFRDVKFPDFGHSNRCVVESHCYFHQHFSNDLCRASFHALICHLCIFFGEVSRSLVPFLIELFVFLLLSFMSSSYILDDSPLADPLSFASIFFPSGSSLLILLRLSSESWHFMWDFSKVLNAMCLRK